ncbi:hypothetical protein ONZ45_g1556 [Pleurotus djamor]|nr:hypothetical protein ONZ45_g1556 [Pleurotus djamor]
MVTSSNSNPSAAPKTSSTSSLRAPPASRSAREERVSSRPYNPSTRAADRTTERLRENHTQTTMENPRGPAFPRSRTRLPSSYEPPPTPRPLNEAKSVRRFHSPQKHAKYANSNCAYRWYIPDFADYPAASSSSSSSSSRAPSPGPSNQQPLRHLSDYDLADITSPATKRTLTRTLNPDIRKKVVPMGFVDAERMRRDSERARRSRSRKN